MIDDDEPTVDLDAVKYMGFFEFGHVDPEHCREIYGGPITDAERKIVLAYMRAATEAGAYKGRAHSRMEGTWKWWSIADKAMADRRKADYLNYVMPFRARMPKFVEPSQVFSPAHRVAHDPAVKASINKILATPPGERAPPMSKEKRKEMIKVLLSNTQKFLDSNNRVVNPGDPVKALFDMTTVRPPADGIRRPEVNGEYRDPVILGCCDMLTPDQKWIFPEAWDTHYVAKHGLVPDREFIDDAVAWSKEAA